MNFNDLHECERQLYSATWILGPARRRRAVERLARENSPGAVRLLVEALDRSKDAGVLKMALRALERLTLQESIDAACAGWAVTRNEELNGLLARQGWVASAPPALRALTALKAGRPDALPHGADLVDRLLDASRDPDTAISGAARVALEKLEDAPARDALCRLVVAQDHPLAREAALTGGYAPREPGQRALFYFLTGQWEKYESLDFDYSLLHAAYGAGDAPLRARIAECARQAGRVEWVQIASGGRQGRRVGQMTEAEWGAALSVLGSGQRWEELWRLAQEAPLLRSIPILQRLGEASWAPGNRYEAAVFRSLVRLALDHSAPSSSSLLRRRRMLVNPTGPPEPVHSITISPDGRRLAVGGSMGGICLWNLRSDAAPSCFAAHALSVTGLGFVQGGQSLASVGGDGHVRLWSMRQGRPVRVLDSDGRWLLALAVSPDGQALASGGGESGVRLRSLPSGQLLKETDGQHGVTTLAFTPDGATLVSGGHDHRMHLWSLPGFQDARILNGHDQSIASLVISPGGMYMASGDNSGKIWLWRLPVGQPLKLLEGHRGSVVSLVMSPGGEMLVSAGVDRTMRVWSVPDGQEMRVYQDPERSPTCLAVEPGGWGLAAGYSDGAVGLWNWEMDRLRRLPARRITMEDLDGARAAIAEGETPDSDRHDLEFLTTLARWRFRFDIQLEESSWRLEAGEFDIEIEG